MKKEMKKKEKGGKKTVLRKGVEHTNEGMWSANADHYATATTHQTRGSFDKFILLSHGFTLNKNS